MKIKRILTVIAALMVAIGTQAYAADYKADERGIVKFNETLDVSNLDFDEELDSYMTYRVEDKNGGLQGFGQLTLNNTGKVSFSVRIKGETGEYKIVLSNVKLGQKLYTVEYVNNCYVEFNDIKRIGSIEQMTDFLNDSGVNFGFDTYVFGLLSKEEQKKIVNAFMEAPDMNSVDEMKEFAKNLDIVSILFRTVSDSDKLIEYIRTSTEKHNCPLNEKISEVFINKISKNDQIEIVKKLMGQSITNEQKTLFEFEVLKKRIHGLVYFADMDEIILDKNNIWGFAWSDINKYANSDKPQVQKEMMKAIDSVLNIEAYRTRFSEIVKANSEESSESDNTQTIITGTQKVTKTYKINASSMPQKERDELADDNSGNVSIKRFTDIDEYEWAKEAINGLVDNYIINGITDTTYEPGRSIKREEFVKMITAGLRLTGAEAEVTLSDVRKEDWFYSVIGAAERAQLITGDDDGHFGVGQYITRQDAAVIAVRAAKYRGVTLNKDKNMKFADETEMAPYAKDAIYELANAGIVNGMSEEIFAPQNNITRAEAAQLLYGLFKTIGVLVW